MPQSEHTKRNPVVLIHGYSDTGLSFEPWRDALLDSGYKKDEIHVCNYKSLTNEVTIKDVAEGFDRALRNRMGLGSQSEFDAIVHSTGILVLRSWLCTYPERRGRLKRLVALAPATFGSPLAHKGRGFIGAMFKGNRVPSPDFLEAGDRILDALELGSRFTWDLTHKDLLCYEPYYSRDSASPYVFIMCGTSGYSGFHSFINSPGTDGTVRWAGCSLDTKKISIHLNQDPTARDVKRFGSSDTAAEKALPMPLWPITGKNHGTIMSEPDGLLRDLVVGALKVSNSEEFDQWRLMAVDATQDAWQATTKWQQFVIRVQDERGDPVTDYHLDFFTRDKMGQEQPVELEADVHVYGADRSLRCFHVNLDLLRKNWGGDFPELSVRFIASSGSELVGYHGRGSQRINKDGTEKNLNGVWDAEIDLPATFSQQGTKFFHPFTTTFIEVTLNRDPMPFAKEPNNICFF